MEQEIEKEEKIYTWGELKAFINTLPEDELSKQVVWWGEERGGTINFAEQLDEDFVLTDEGCEPLSVQEPLEEGEDEWETAYAKGTPILHTD